MLWEWTEALGRGSERCGSSRRVELQLAARGHWRGGAEARVHATSGCCADGEERRAAARLLWRRTKLAELQALLDAHKAAGIDPLYPYVVEMPVGIDKSLEKHFESGDEYIYWPN